jgi:hypothetical protein
LRTSFGCFNRTVTYRDKKVVGVFVRFRAPLHREGNVSRNPGSGGHFLPPILITSNIVQFRSKKALIFLVRIKRNALLTRIERYHAKTLPFILQQESYEESHKASTSSKKIGFTFHEQDISIHAW